MAKVASEDAAMKVRTNLAEYLEKGIVKQFFFLITSKNVAMSFKMKCDVR